MLTASSAQDTPQKSQGTHVRVLPFGSKGTSCHWQENPAAAPTATMAHRAKVAPHTNAIEILSEMP